MHSILPGEQRFGVTTVNVEIPRNEAQVGPNLKTINVPLKEYIYIYIHYILYIYH